jgi:hypothetical protein
MRLLTRQELGIGGQPTIPAPVPGADCELLQVNLTFAMAIEHNGKARCGCSL